MALGLQNAFGLENAQQGLRQRIIDQLNQQKQQQDMRLAEREQALREQDAQQRAEQFKMTQADHAAALSERTQAANVTNATKLAPDLPMDQNVAPAAAGILDRGGMGGQLYAPPTQGETESGKPFVSAEQNPRMNLGTPVQQKDAADSAAIDAMAKDPNTTPAMRGFLRVRGALPKGENVPYQLITEPNGPPKAPGQPVQVGPKGVFTRPEDAIGQEAYHPPVQAPQPIVVQTAAGPQLLDRRAGTASPITDKGGTVVGPAPSGTERTRAASAKAVLQTGDDIVSELQQPDFAGKIGPALGRFNSLREFIGNPPPEFSQLAGQIESYALASMGVHGMRSVSGSEKIKALLDGHHTPESLIGAIKGLNGFAEHFVSNESGTGAQRPAGGAAKPSAADLIKKYSTGP
jgi:hypothetical protein